MMAGDRWMAHSLLSAPLNLGLLDPVEVVRAAEDAYRGGHAPLASVEGFIRQVVGWRDYVWHLYWHLGQDYRRRNELGARGALPAWFADLDADAVDARCLRHALTSVRETGWAHHIPRLMVLGNYALQRGWDPPQRDRLVPPRLRRRLRLGDGAQRRRDVPARRRRRDGHQAVRRRRRLHRQDERPLRRLRLRPEGAGRRARLPVHRRLLGVPAPAPRAASRPTRGCGRPCAAWTGSRTSTGCSPSTPVTVAPTRTYDSGNLRYRKLP